jgi:ubiquinone/menaquinone biosynthesis C-methylase UbiE
VDQGRAKRDIHDFWSASACGEAYAIGPDQNSRQEAQAKARYGLEPYLRPFAKFEDGRGRDVLEIGIGMGADHVEWARSQPRSLTGIDLTERAIEFTRARLATAGLASNLVVADAENLPFADESFDLVYSWGVLHHSPDTAAAFREVGRVLRPGGIARIMIYHSWSLTGLMLWTRYGLLRGRPTVPFSEIYDQHLESPGTKAYSKAEAEGLCKQAGLVNPAIRTQLNHGDLLEGQVGRRHGGSLLPYAKKLWPRWLFHRLTPFLGLYLLIEVPGRTTGSDQHTLDNKMGPR